MSDPAGKSRAARRPPRPKGGSRSKPGPPAASQKPAAPRDWTRQFLDLVGVIVVVINADQTIRVISRKGCEVLGYLESELLGQNWFDMCVPERIRPEVKSLFEELMRGGAGLTESHYVNPVLTRGGGERLIAWQNTVLVRPDGTLEGTLSSGEDITDQKTREDSLRSREAELQAIVDTAVDGIITIDERGRLRSFNTAATRLFGYRPEEVIGKNVSMLMPAPDSAHHDDYLRNYHQTGDAKIIGIGREVYGKRKDGTTFPLYLSVSETRLPDRLLFTGIVHDMTAFRQMQQQLMQAKNLAAIGEMAATVAHEIKNPLAGISGAIHVLRDTLQGDDPRRDIMGEILEQVRRLDETVRQLLMLSKPWKPSKQNCELRNLVRQISSVAEEDQQYSHIRFIFEGEERLHAQVDPTMLQQVLLNLIQNSAQAIQGQGQITFTFERDGNSPRILVTDSGPGVAPEIRDRLFRPFVTTKAHGTGLGLAICKKILEAHGGTISIESPPGAGAVVSLVFPRETAEKRP